MDKMKPLALLETFPPVPTELWEEVIKKDLKGADYAKKLFWNTEDGVTLRPYYRSEDLKGLEEFLAVAPGEYPFTRGAKRAANDWRIREEITESDPAKANELAKKAIEAGAEEICFVLESGIDGLRGIAAYDAQQMAILLRSLALEKIPVHFRAGSRARHVYGQIVEALGPRAAHLNGSIDYDPLGALVLTGFSANDRKGIFDEAAEMVRRARAKTPLFRVLAVRGGLFNEAGGTTIQELGYALAQGIEYVSELTQRNLTAEQVAGKMFFRFSIGPNFFFVIAKLRAARFVWSEAAKAFGIPESACAPVIDLRTANWNTTIYDPYVNMLRATTEAMAAAIGGCNSLTVVPFDAIYKAPDDFSRRMARNTQIILKKESYLDRAIDPAAGSYYVASVTNSVAREAWKLMQRIESAGGFLKSLQAGTIQQEVNAAHKNKENRMAMRRRKLLGTNEYPNRKERMLEKLTRVQGPPGRPEGQVAIQVTPLRPHRAAEMYEALRLRMERHAQKTGHTLQILLLEIGDQKWRKLRSGFCLNFFGCGGFEPTTIFAPNLDTAVKETVSRTPDAVVLCSSDPEYPQIAAPYISKLRAAGKQWPVIVAGNPKDAMEKLKQDGVADFVHRHSNAVEVLKSWQNRLGVTE
jgi:methylmalonyl-CoA mutase